jgi:hypothetical protein
MKNPSTTQKSAHVTLRANGNTLMLLATLKAGGTVVTTATVRDAEKKLSRGMTEQHPDMAKAKVYLAGLAKKAEEMGWTRRAGGAAKPDAFSKLPAAPKAVA